MNGYLIHFTELWFSLSRNSRQDAKSCLANIIPQENCADSVNYCEALKQTLITDYKLTSSKQCLIKISVAVDVTENVPTRPTKLTFKISGELLTKMWVIFHKEKKNVGLKLHLRQSTLTPHKSHLNDSNCVLGTFEMTNSLDTWQASVELPDKIQQLAGNHMDWIFHLGRSTWHWAFTLEFYEKTLPGNQHELCCNFYKKLLEDKTGADMTIISNDGTPFKCHKFILSAHSPVLSAMCNNQNFVEGITSEVRMADMTNDGIEAFLKFLYYFELNHSTLFEKGSVAVELLEAGHKYDIPPLEQTILQLLASKPVDDEFFTVENALRLFTVTRGGAVAHSEQFNKKIVQVLKLKHEELANCSLYHQMWETNFELTLDLFQLSLEN